MTVIKKLISATLLCLITSCSSSISNIKADSVDNEEAMALATQAKGKVSKYLCVTLPSGTQSEIVKVQNLATKEMVSLPVPGSVQGMSENIANNIIYINAKDGPYYSLYKLDLKTRQITRILSFSQLGIKPTDFMVKEDKVYVTGKRGDVGTFYGNDLVKNEWFAIANNISPGKIKRSLNENNFHVVSYDDSYVTRTTVDIKLKQITARKTIKHTIPFGNNVFMSSPYGAFVYVLHQLKDSFIPYAFNVKQGNVNQFDEVKTDGGLLYSAIVSNDGKHLFTNVNREIYHYKLEDDKLIAMPKVVLSIPESRNMAMASDNTTLMITHETGSNMSVVKFSADYSTYTVTPMNIGGSSNQIYIF